MTVNVENINLLIERLNSVNSRTFSMSYFHEEKVGCGSTHCIAGWAQIVSGKEECSLSAFNEAAIFLGIPTSSAFGDPSLATLLFTPDGGELSGKTQTAHFEAGPRSKNYISRNRAVRQLEFLRDNGTVDWRETPNERR